MTLSERILIVEPDATLRESISLHVSLEGFACEVVADSTAALTRAEADRFDAVIVDEGHGASSGRLCDALRGRLFYQRAPILLLAPQSREADALAALERCVDDYLPTPFGMRELVARLRALIRRSRLSEMREAHGQSGVIVRRGLVIDPARRRVQMDQQPLTLTEQEFQLLRVLAERAGVVFTRDALLAEIWGERTFVTVRSVDALVKRVRRRLRGIHQRPYVVTVRGVGYKLDDSTFES